ncbi:MAG: hypothetical protein IJ896_01065 [Fibrobacter sp.]|nr:hypothetical protein [Fibrobacter sp.]
MANDTKMLSDSRQRRSDEYYTLYEDIADELSNYRDQFRGKHIICPCDWDESLDEVCVYASEEEVAGGQLFTSGTVKTIDAGKSAGHIEKDIRLIKCNFVKYLVSHAEDWGIASISVSGYNPATGEGVRFQDLDYSRYDICVTNPPFSQFIEFVETMFRGNMKFVIIGPQDAVTYQSVFKHFMDNEMWLGYRYHLAGFIRPDGTRINKQDNLARSCCWYTNMEVAYRNRRQEYDSEYDPERYPRYDNYDAIHVSYSKDIPYDYDGPMGVPVTFLQKYCSRQFVLLGQTDNSGALRDLQIPGQKKYDRPYLNGKRLFPRLIIQKRKEDE